jgi:hypothetical protein
MMRSNEVVFYAYGYARYTDTFGDEHETRFGVIHATYAVSSRYDNWIIAGPAAYNKST